MNARNSDPLNNYLSRLCLTTDCCVVMFICHPYLAHMSWGRGTWRRLLGIKEKQCKPSSCAFFSRTQTELGPIFQVPRCKSKFTPPPERPPQSRLFSTQIVHPFWAWNYCLALSSRRSPRSFQTAAAHRGSSLQPARRRAQDNPFGCSLMSLAGWQPTVSRLPPCQLLQHLLQNSPSRA